MSLSPGSKTRLLTFSALILILTSNVFFADARASGTIRILFTNNSNGKLKDCNCPTDPFGGLAERVALIREYKTYYDDFLLLDSGGYLGLSRSQDKGTAVFRLMDIMGYNFYGIGDQELYYSLAGFLNKYGQWKDKIISASLRAADGETVFTPYKVVVTDSVRVGILGLAAHETFRFFPDQSRDFSVEDPDSTLARFLPVLERECDYIVVLSQMGREKDTEIAKSRNGIDLIIGGHSQTLLEKPIRIGNCHIVQAGKGGGRVGEIVVRLDNENNVNDFSYKLFEVSERYTIPEDIIKEFDKVLEYTQ